MRATSAMLLLVLFCGCTIEPDTSVEYQCWDGSIVLDLDDCLPTTRLTTTSTTTTTTTQPCQWQADTCRMYCSRECGELPLLDCRLDETRCECEFSCGTTTTTSPKATTTTLKKWLSDREIDEAIEWGKENKFNLSYMLATYSYPNYTVGFEHVIIYTPYLNMALAAAAKARDYRALSDAEIDAIASENEIKFKVKVYGNTRTFAGDVHAVIKIRDDVIHPKESVYDDEPETTASWPKSPAYFAVNTYTFEDYGELRDRNIKFVVIKYNGEEEYPIDMSEYA